MNVQDYLLNNSGDEIPWRLFTPENASKKLCVLWLQGWSTSMDSHRESVERISTQTGVAFATLDPAGHGLHKLPLDESTRKQQHEEVVAVFDELKKLGYDKIVVVGGSFGGYMAALLTEKRPVHSVILRAPANYPDDEFEQKNKEPLRSKDYAAYTNSKGSDKELADTSAIKAISNFIGFTYVLEHEFDEVVPAKVPKSYFNAAMHGNYLIIPNVKRAPKTMENPEVYYAYIEHIITSIIKAIQMQGRLPDETL